MRTYRAETAKWRLKPLHATYIARAKAHAALIMRHNGSRHPMNETTCPFCGHDGGLQATVRIGAKQLAEKVPLTREGYVVDWAGDRDTELLVIRCTQKGCKATIPALAFISPCAFYTDHTGEQLLPPIEEY